MTMTTNNELHLNDEELVLFLDREGNPLQLKGWENHLEECHPCGERFDQLKGAADWFASEASRLDAEVVIDELARARALAAARKANRSSALAGRHLWGRAAAAAIVVIGLGMTVEPVRAWVMDRTGFGESAPETTTEVVAPLAESPVVSFAPTAEIFVIELDSFQASGSMQISAVDGVTANAWMVNPDTEIMSVLPAGLLIGNLSSSTAEYRIEMPTGLVRTIELRVGGETFARIPVSSRMEAQTIELASGADQP